jgi:hypothetical protein
MSAKDKQRLAIAIGLAVVVAAALYFLVFRKPKEEAGVAQAPASSTQGTGGLATAPAGKAGGAAGAKAPAGALGSKAAVAAAFAAALAAKAQPAAVAVQPQEPSRADPFAPLIRPPRWVPPPPPPPPAAVIQVGMPPVMTGALPLEATIMARGQRRTAGVLWNDRVLAIIETEKTTAVVQPGDTVDGETIRSISPEGVVLAVKGGQEVDVPLQAAEPGTRRPTPVTPVGSPELPGAPAPPGYGVY